jgi:hypothetical protein
MAQPVLTPERQESVVVLPETGSAAAVIDANLPFGMYVDSAYWNATEIASFQEAAADQVNYVYRKLVGDVLDIELTAKQVYAAYEEAVLEYSYLLNIHQGKNILSNILGGSTGSFTGKGQITGSNGSVDKDFHLGLKYPKFDFSYARRIAEGISQEAGVGGSLPFYSASFDISVDVQDYDLQAIMAAKPEFSDPTSDSYIGSTRILVRRVFYKTPSSGWNFYGYYGGINVVGNAAQYGQYSDSSTFEVVPAWQNKLQAMAFEDHLYTRAAHYSYELKNNKLRIFPIPDFSAPMSMWIEFTVAQDTWEDDEDAKTGIDGISNLSNAPFQNLPFTKINSIGKQWIRRFALSLCKEMLGLVRSKFATIPIPNNEVTLNGPQLIDQAKDEMEKLREELKEILTDLEYSSLVEGDAKLAASAQDVMGQVPRLIYVG